MAKKRHAVVDLPVYVLVRSLFFSLTWLPEWIVYPALDALGRGFLLVARGRRRISLDNLRTAFGDTLTEIELTRLASRACGNAFMVIADIAKLERYTLDGTLDERCDLSRYARIRPELLRLAEGKPPVLCTPHLGSWEVAGMLVGREFSGVHVIARPLGNRYLHAFITSSRSQLGQHMHPRRGGIRYLLEGLRRGQAVGSLPDQNQRLRGIFVPVFGKLASCDRSQARLAQMAGAPILVGAAIRVGRRFRFAVDIADMFKVAAKAPQGQTAEDVVYEATCRLQRGVEQLILRSPDQYFWVHNRYRTRPPEENSPDNGASGKSQERKRSA